MAKHKHVVIMLDLMWPYKRHHGVFAGTQEYARRCKTWDCTIVEYADKLLEPTYDEPPCDGIIARATPQLAADARRLNIPLVNVWSHSLVSDVPLVTPNYDSAGRMAAEHLVARGFRNFGFMGYSCKREPQRKGFTKALAQAGFSHSTFVVPSNYGHGSVAWNKFLTQMNEWIDSWPLPIGICVSYDLLARYLACACRQKGVSIPNDAALVGSHNETVICLAEPNLTSIEIGYERVGYRAAELLDQMMDGAPAPTEPILVEPTNLIPRQSSDALAVEDPLVAQALRYTSENSHKMIRVNDIANAVHVNRRTLERRFRSVLGRSVTDEIMRLRVERVKRLLVETKTPLKIMAIEAGFGDGAHMLAIFKRIEGTTPSAYRREHRRDDNKL
ncbi:MAG: substrate-binding domain-containing protein [Phycisphaerales bacterium]|nr:substrate-binding domain-containing protein [Phycisphaerales bacterium]